MRQLFDRPDAEVDLTRAALTLARIRYPDLQDEPTLAWLDRRAEEVQAALEHGDEPDEVVSAISRVLFEQWGFEGNRSDYYDPRNSFLNDVIERRTGIPIALSVVYMEIGKRIQAPIYGVGLPGHFLVKYHDARRRIYVDPFHEGRVLNRQGCRNLVKRLSGRPVELTDLHFAAMDNRSIILRMCNNLRDIFLSSRQLSSGLEVIRTVLALAPDSAEEIKQTAWLYHELGQRGKALAAIEHYNELHPEPEEGEDLEAWSENIRRAQAQLN
ncbi:MAG: transglutaminase-like domain-containing protein [Bryobacterales bacterium]